MKYFILIIIGIIFSSCCKNIEFEPEYKFWFENYSVGDRIIFKSQKGDLDTLLIKNISHKIPDGKCSYMVSSYDKEFVRIDYEIKKDTFKILTGYLVQIAAEPKSNETIPVLRFLNMEFNREKLPELTKSLNTKWKESYIFDSSFCTNNLNGKYGITRFEWNKNYGLVSYQNSNGEKWNYLKKE